MQMTICVQLADKKTRFGEQTAVFPDNQSSDKDDKDICKTESQLSFKRIFSSNRHDIDWDWNII